MDNLEPLRLQCLQCQACRLAKTRKNVVFGVGPVPSALVFIGEGPGEHEDLQGEPFVGAAGKLLDEMLSIIDLSRQTCYITNIVKCRPPHNRDPMEDEQEACADVLSAQLASLRPKVIVCLGRVAAKRLIDPEFRITREHGKWSERGGISYMATYHPSALLRDVNKRPEAFSDLLSLREKIKQLGIVL